MINFCTHHIKSDHWLHKEKFCGEEIKNGKCPKHGEDINAKDESKRQEAIRTDYGNR